MSCTSVEDVVVGGFSNFDVDDIDEAELSDEVDVVDNEVDEVEDLIAVSIGWDFGEEL